MGLEFIKTLTVILIISKGAFQLDSISASLVSEREHLHREKRQLLYPYSTVLQLNIGVGTPTPIKTIQINWAIQANFQLPWNRTQIPFLHGNGREDSSRQIRDNQNLNGDENEKFDDSLRSKDNDEFKLYHLYKNIEEMLNASGYDGPMCVRQVLCQLAGDPLYPHDEEDLLHEIVDFLLNPNHDTEDGDISANSDALQYIEAYDYGLKSEDCFNRYKGCSLSLLDMFSKLY